jgi:peptide/nickel transport system substrate-binding protein
MSRRKTVRYAVPALVAVVSAVLAGCSGPPSTTSGNSPGIASTGGTGPAKFTPISDVASCPSGPKGTLNFVGDIGGPYARNFNPFSASANTGAQQAFVYETLLQFSLSQSKVVAPWLASAYSWSDGGRKLTFTIRSGIKWSDGQPFGAADVAYTFNLLKKDPATNLKGIVFNTVTASGNTVTMTFAKPEYTELFYIGTQYIVPQHIWSKIADPSKSLNLNPVGTGPYLLKQLTSQTLIMTANPHYWRPDSPCIKTISAPPYVSNNSADLAMETGQGQWGGLFVAGMSHYTGTAGHEYWNPPTNDVALYPNLTLPVFKSTALRQAISAALNRPKIEQLGEQGEEEPISNQTGIILPRDKSQLAAQYQSATFSPSVAKAKSILKHAGYTYSSSGQLMTPAKKPVAFSVIAPAAFSDWIAATQEVVTELKGLGIDARLSTVANVQWVADMENGSFQMGIDAGELGPNSFYQYDGWLLSSAKVGSLAPTNFERYSSPKANALINSYLGTDSTAVQNKDMAGLESIMVNDVPVIPIYYATDWGLYETNHISGWPSPQDPYEIASSYDTPQNEVVLLHLKWKG